MKPDERAREQRVFLSHSSVDKPFVRLLAADITRFGVGIWLDELELKLADSLIIKISEAIQTSAFVAACLSPHSVESVWVKRELSIGSTLAITSSTLTVMPLLLDGLTDAEIPAFMVDQLYADFRGPEKYDSAFHRLLRCIKPDTASVDREDILSNFDFDPLPIDDRRIYDLIRAASKEPMKSWMVDYLIHSVSTHRDATERYWIYVGLGELGGEKAQAMVQEGLQDASTFARRGAKKAAQKLGI